ncbi:MAG: hypothetical protein ACFFDM_10555 [Candidatus Thorarchaeota archaeon]
MGKVEEFQDSIELDYGERLKKSLRRRIIIGAIMLVMLPLLPIVVFLIQYSVSDFVIMMVFVIFGIIGFSGVIVVGYYGMGSSVVLSNYELFKELAPPNPIIVDKTAILNRDPVYLIAQWGSNTIFFIAFRHAERSFEEKIQVPRVIWTWEYTHQIGDLKVARREGSFTIPVEEGRYISGEGILYSLMTEKGPYRIRIRIDFTPEQINQIIDRLTEDIQSDASGF